jgi:hypothetical protein
MLDQQILELRARDRALAKIVFSGSTMKVGMKSGGIDWI